MNRLFLSETDLANIKQKDIYSQSRKHQVFSGLVYKMAAQTGEWSIV